MNKATETIMESDDYKRGLEIKRLFEEVQEQEKKVKRRRVQKAKTTEDQKEAEEGTKDPKEEQGKAEQKSPESEFAGSAPAASSSPSISWRAWGGARQAWNAGRTESKG